MNTAPKPWSLILAIVAGILFVVALALHLRAQDASDRDAQVQEAVRALNPAAVQEPEDPDGTLPALAMAAGLATAGAALILHTRRDG